MLVTAVGLLLDCHGTIACCQVLEKRVDQSPEHFLLSNRRYDNGVSGGVSGMNSFLEKFYPSASLLNCAGVL